MLIHPVGICRWCVFMAAALRVLMHFYTTGKKTKSRDLRCCCERDAAGRGSCRWVPIVRRSQSHSCHRYVWITANYFKLPLSLACIQWLLNTNRAVSAAGRRQEWPPLRSCAALQARDVKLLIESLGNRNAATSSSLIVCAWTMSETGLSRESGITHIAKFYFWVFVRTHSFWYVCHGETHEDPQ